MDFNYETITTLLATFILIGALLSLAVSFIMEFIIKTLFKEITKHVFAMNITICIMSLIVAVFFGWYKYQEITILSSIFTVAMWIMISAISMNGYDKVYSYIWGSVKKFFNKE